MTQSNAHRCGTTYLTLNNGPSKGNITRNKRENSITNPFGRNECTNIIEKTIFNCKQVGRVLKCNNVGWMYIQVKLNLVIINRMK